MPLAGDSTGTERRMSAEQRFLDKRALVTGGASGFGRAVASRLAREGAKVVILDIDESAARAAVEAEGLSGCVVADLAVPEQVADAVELATADLGGLSLLVNNAGIEIHGDVLSLSLQQWQQTFAVNSTGVFLVSKSALPALLDAEESAIVNIASDAGVNGELGLDAYVASKHAVIGLTKCMALAWGARGLRTNAVCPGMGNTPLTALKSQELIDAYERLVPMRRLGEPEEIADAVAYLLSPAASYVNGIALLVDGGGMAGNYFADEDIRS
jgi:NAD(P)-dependent dehydrogenase (short-subunit alcohol dehydrogenase family)